jgi:hypothetical protein
LLADTVDSNTNEQKNFAYTAFKNRDFRFFNNLYKLGMHNFLAAVPDFFLQGRELQTISSAPQKEFKLASRGTLYTMDVVLDLNQSEAPFMVGNVKFEFGDISPWAAVYHAGLPPPAALRYFDGSNTFLEGVSVFGPPSRWWNASDAEFGGGGVNPIAPSSSFASIGAVPHITKILSPAFAPFAPPYYFGEAIARIKFTPTQTRQYSLQDIIKNSTVEYISEGAEGLFKKYAYQLGPDASSSIIGPDYDYDDNYSKSPAWRNKMNIDSSVSLFGIAENLNTTFDENNAANSAQTTDSTNLIKWVIQTKFETPYLYPEEFTKTPNELENPYYDASEGARAEAEDAYSEALDAYNEALDAYNASVDAYSLAEEDYDSALAGGDPIEIASALAALQSAEQDKNNAYAAQIPAQQAVDEALKKLNGLKNRIRFHDVQFNGIWTSKCIEPSGSAITLSIRESFNIVKDKQTQETTGSLLDLCGFKPETKTIGKIASKRAISEGLIIIPYTKTKNDGNNSDDRFAETIDIEKQKTDPTYYFKLPYDIIERATGVVLENKTLTTDQISKLLVKNRQRITEEGARTNTIAEAMQGMCSYIIPPHLNWVTNKEIEPFVMLFVKFDKNLNKQDLIDIWQGVMPEAINDVDNISKRIFVEEYIFQERNLPTDIKFKIFKVKEKAPINYYKLTKNSLDDKRFSFSFTNDPKEKAVPEYSYNWPNDFFSLIEGANMEIELISDE